MCKNTINVRFLAIAVGICKKASQLEGVTSRCMQRCKETKLQEKPETDRELFCCYQWIEGSEGAFPKPDKEQNDNKMENKQVVELPNLHEESILCTRKESQ